MESCKLVCLPISTATGCLTKVTALHSEPPWLWTSAESWCGKRLSSSQGSVARTRLAPAALQSCGPAMPNRGAPEGALTLMQNWIKLQRQLFFNQTCQSVRA